MTHSERLSLAMWLALALLPTAACGKDAAKVDPCERDDSCDSDDDASDDDDDDDDDDARRDAGKTKPDAGGDDDDDDDDDDNVARDAAVRDARAPTTPGAMTPDASRDAASAVARDAAMAMPGPMTPPTPRGDKTCLMGTSADYKANGPYQVKMKDVMLEGGLGPYTIFYPTQLSSDCPHPIVGWGNGTGVTGSGTYAHFFRHAATWGIVTIVAHNSNAGSMPFIARGIDYLLKENMTSGSEFFGKLSTRAGSSGHSQGGFAAITAASHPNIQAIVNVQGGGRPPPKAAMICLTGVMDSVRMPCTSSYNAATGPAFLSDHQMADHTGTPTPLGARTPAGQEYIRMYTSWFRCFLGDDAAACALYKGAMPPVCSGGMWANCSGKNIP